MFDVTERNAIYNIPSPSSVYRFYHEIESISFGTFIMQFMPSTSIVAIVINNNGQAETITHNRVTNAAALCALLKKTGVDNNSRIIEAVSDMGNGTDNNIELFSVSNQIYSMILIKDRNGQYPDIYLQYGSLFYSSDIKEEVLLSNSILISTNVGYNIIFNDKKNGTFSWQTDTGEEIIISRNGTMDIIDDNEDTTIDIKGNNLISLLSDALEVSEKEQRFFSNMLDKIADSISYDCQRINANCFAIVVENHVDRWKCNFIFIASNNLLYERPVNVGKESIILNNGMTSLERFIRYYSKYLLYFVVDIICSVTAGLYYYLRGGNNAESLFIGITAFASTTSLLLRYNTDLNERNKSSTIASSMICGAGFLFSTVFLCYLEVPLFQAMKAVFLLHQTTRYHKDNIIDMRLFSTQYLRIVVEFCSLFFCTAISLAIKDTDGVQNMIKMLGINAALFEFGQFEMIFMVASSISAAIKSI